MAPPPARRQLAAGEEIGEGAGFGGERFGGREKQSVENERLGLREAVKNLLLVYWLCVCLNLLYSQLHELIMLLIFSEF